MRSVLAGGCACAASSGFTRTHLLADCTGIARPVSAVNIRPVVRGHDLAIGPPIVMTHVDACLRGAVAAVALLLFVASEADTAVISRLLPISGDRRILVNVRTAPQPDVVRGLDAMGYPVSGATIFIGSGADPRLSAHLCDALLGDSMK